MGVFASKNHDDDDDDESADKEKENHSNKILVCSTLLIGAVQSGNIDLVLFYIDNGASLDATSVYKDTPLECVKYAPVEKQETLRMILLAPRASV